METSAAQFLLAIMIANERDSIASAGRHSGEDVRRAGKKKNGSL